MFKKYTFCFFLLLLIVGFPADSLAGGKVTGKITISKESDNKDKRKSRLSYKSDQSSHSSHSSGGTFNKVVVYLEYESNTPYFAPPSKLPALTQKNAEFVPAVLPILKGSTVNIKNEDKIYHNVFSLSELRPFNIGRRPRGENVPIDFNQAGVIRVFCDIHSNMSAYIIVLNNPFFVHPDEHGNYSLTDIPAGKYKVHVWHERMEAKNQSVEIKEGETVQINFTLQ